MKARALSSAIGAEEGTKIAVLTSPGVVYEGEFSELDEEGGWLDISTADGTLVTIAAEHVVATWVPRG